MPPRCNIFLSSASSYMSKGIKEKILLYRIRGRKDAGAFAELYDIYVSAVYRFVFLKVSNKEEAEDITSEVFMRAWDYMIDTASPAVGSFRALIYSIARNRIIDFYRDRARRKECALTDVGDIHIRADLHLAVDVGMETDRVLVLMKRLKDEYQEIIHLNHVAGLSIREIAKVLGKSSGSVRVTLHRAVKKMQEMANSSKSRVRSQ